MKSTAIAFIAAVCSCATPPPPARGVASSVASPNASFATYRTFSFGPANNPPPSYQITPRSLEVQRRLHSVVLTTLQKHGYLEDSSKADFIVKLAAGTGEGPNPPAEHGDFVRSSPARTPPAQGFIGIGIYDAPSGAMVWQGSAFAEIDPAKIDDALLQRGVDHMLAEFPPAPATGSGKPK